MHVGNSTTPYTLREVLWADRVTALLWVVTTGVLALLVAA